MKNIIYILSDQHNPEVIACKGDPYVRTPNLDRLYSEGTSLDNCYCAAPLCVPSRSAMLTGLLPSHNGVYNNMQNLRTAQPTLPAGLTLGGYETVLCGRMHFVGWDQRHGFEKRFVGDITPCFIGGDNEREIYGDFMRSSGQNLTSIRKSGAGHSAVLDYDESVTGAAIDYLKNRSDERPLFMTVGFYGPHCPYIAPKELYDYYYNLLPPMPYMSAEERAKMHPAIQNWYANRKMEEVKDEDVRRIRASYYALVELMDSYVGRIVKTIEETIGLENTLIIYGSDHGDNIGEHGLFWKTNFYEGAGRVPMVFVGSDIPKGRAIKENTSLLDLAPTLLSYSGLEQLPTCDGVDLSENLRGKEIGENTRPVISMCSDIKGDNPSAMIRKGKWKLVAHAGYEAKQLFDIETDVKELCDLGTDPAYRSTVDELYGELSKYWNPEEELEKLRIAKLEFKLMKRWYELAPQPLVEEWRGDSANNYLL